MGGAGVRDGGRMETTVLEQQLKKAKKDVIYLVLETVEGREKERKNIDVRNIHQLPLVH